MGTNANIPTQSTDQSAFSRSLLTAFMALTGFMFLTSPAAADSSGVSTVLCSIEIWLNGGIGHAIAVLAVIIIGIGAMLGKVSWGLALIVIVGISLAYQANTIVTMIAPNWANSGGCN